MEGYYSSIAHGYDELHHDEQQKKLMLIKRFLNPEKSARLLDVGCGTGLSSGFGCFVVGIDPSLGMLRQNRKRNRVLGLAESLPFKSGSFDFVISVTAIHNFSDISRAMREMKRVGKGECRYAFSVLKKSGKFGIIRQLAEKEFLVENAVEEDKDMILLCRKPHTSKTGFE